jgi:hypothetical protein
MEPAKGPAKAMAERYKRIERITGQKILETKRELEDLARWESQSAWTPGFEPEHVDHPDHYNQGRFEVIDVIEDWNLGFSAGNAVKYIARHKFKGKPVEDLKKARWYIDRLIQQLELEEENG